MTALGVLEPVDREWLEEKMAVLAEHEDKQVAARAQAVLRRLQQK